MERLAIDEIIEHCERKTKLYEEVGKSTYFETTELTDAIKEYWEHRQVKEYLEELKRYRDLEEQGLLLRLPCKVGNTVYRYVEEKGCVLEYTVWNISMSAYESGGIDIVIEGCAESEDEVEDEFSLSLIDFKNEFFNTKAEAEQKLKEMNTNNGITE